MLVLLSVATLAVPNEAPPNSSSTLSPATAVEPLVGKVARKLVVVDSALLIKLSAKSVLPVSASVGAAGAAVSSVKLMVLLAVPTLPATSVMRLLSALAPSAPRSALRTVKST